MSTQDLIEEYRRDLRENSRSEETQNAYVHWLTAADLDLPYGLDAATGRELRSWLWRDGYQNSSRGVMHAALVGFFAWAIRNEVLDFNPAAELPRPRAAEGVPRVASDVQAEMILTDAAQPYLLWAKLAAYGGLRCVEMFRLHREHITEDSMQVHGKGDKHRSVPTHPVIWEAVKDLPDGPVCDVASKNSLSTRFRQYTLKRYGKAIGLHRLRGWFATTAYTTSKDPRAVQTLLGHSNLATTTRYIAAAEPQRRAVVAGLPTFSAAVPAGAGAPARRQRAKPAR